MKAPFWIPEESPSDVEYLDMQSILSSADGKVR